MSSSNQRRPSIKGAGNGRWTLSRRKVCKDVIKLQGTWQLHKAIQTVTLARKRE